MRLARIDAIRFGALEGSCLSDLGPELTVVLGPNECGKSTYTALVRHVLFGFPMGKGKAGERFYKPLAGNRAARLVFADESGEWAVERVEGKRGGDVTISALRGPERPGLLGEMVGDLTESSYRVVFGFGLDEMDDIENGDDRHLGARLYAAGSGLETNPLDVREALQKSAEALFTPRARISTVNAGVGRMKDLRDRIREMEAEASAFADDQALAQQLAAGLEPLRARRDETDARVRALDRDAQRVRDIVDSCEEIAAQRDAAGRRIAELERTIAEAVPDERVLAVESELDALLEEQSGFRQRLETLNVMASGLQVTRLRYASLAGLPVAATDSVENRTRVDAWIARRAAIEGECRAAERQAEQVEARAREYATSTPVAAANRRPWVAIGAVALGTVFAGAGLYAGQLLAALLGALVAAIGVVLVFVRGGVTGDLSGDAARAAADARAARAFAGSARAALAAEDDAWRSWIAERSLDAHGDDPVAVRALLDELRERSVVAAEVSRLEAEADRELTLATRWADRLVAASRGFLGLVEEVPLEETMVVAARAREALDSARATSERRARAVEEHGAAVMDREALDSRFSSQQQALDALSAAHGVPSDDALRRLDALMASEAAALDVLRHEVDLRADELSTLRGRLDTEGRDSAMALARQAMEGLQAEVQAAADRYVVDALATRLLDRARERFERERKPEVTRMAASAFRSMTGGRYTDVLVPMGSEGIQVITRSGGLKTSAELSRGTAEQLYLALRIGFLSSLKTGLELPVLMDDVVVNFDAERRAGAAAAIAELARGRQVIFFTCHEETAAVLAEAAPDRTTIALDRCELRG
jgi:uncharacterized protein YhaN